MSERSAPSFELIQTAHDEIGYTLGWRFLYSPAATLTSAHCAVITLNPGGGTFHEPRFSIEGGNAYVDESWPGKGRGAHPIQRQVQRLFALMEERPNDVLSGVYVPFRSPNWHSLPQKSAALAFARNLWEPIFEAHCPATIVCVGKQIVGEELSRLLGAQLVERKSADWGEITVDLYRHSRGRIIVTPHLSRFTIFGREGGDHAFRELLRA